MLGYEFLAFGTLWFWLLVGAESLLLMCLVAKELIESATVTLVFTLVALQLCGTPVLSYAWANAGAIGLWAAAYVVVGVLWSVAKWWMYVSEQRDKYDVVKKAWLAAKNKTSIAPEDKGDFHYALCRADVKVKPQVSDEENKSRICSWIAYWPWSAAVALVHDPIRKVSRLAYKGIKIGLQKISDHAFAGTEDEL